MTRPIWTMKRYLYVLVVCFWTSISCSSQKPQHPNDAEVAQQMFAATKDHHYDEAVQIGLEALKTRPSDGLLLLQVGLVYMKRAMDDPQQRGRWLDLATEYANRTVAVTPSDELNYFNAARIYESAGDLSTENRCSFYRRASELFNRLAARLGDQTGSHQEGQSRSEILRRNARESAAQVAKKAALAGCQHAIVPRKD